MIELWERCDAVSTRGDLAEFIQALSWECEANGSSWENPTLSGYIAALHAWTRDMPGFFKNQGLDETQQPTWNLIAHLLYAATMYE